MCGISAILLHPRQRSATQWQAIREFFTGDLLFNEDRGRDATGLAIVRSDGQVSLFKEALPAAEFVQTSQYHDLLATVGPQTTLILGHTRAPTKGDPAFPGNNHPIQTGPVFGVHNGHIDNDDELFLRLGCLRQAQVDSEIIFHILAATSPMLTPQRYLETLGPRLELLKGSYTFLAVDCRRPTRLIVLRHDNPLLFHHHHDWNALIFSSRYIFMRKYFGPSLGSDVVEQDRLMLFDAGKIVSRGRQTVREVALFSSRKE